MMRFLFAGKQEDTNEMSLPELIALAHNTVRFETDKESCEWRAILQEALRRARLLMAQGGD